MQVLYPWLISIETVKTTSMWNESYVKYCVENKGRFETRNKVNENKVLSE